MTAYVAVPATFLLLVFLLSSLLDRWCLIANLPHLWPRNIPSTYEVLYCLYCCQQVRLMSKLLLLPAVLSKCYCFFSQWLNSTAAFCLIVNIYLSDLSFKLFLWTVSSNQNNHLYHLCGCLRLSVPYWWSNWCSTKEERKERERIWRKGGRNLYQWFNNQVYH